MCLIFICSYYYTSPWIQLHVSKQLFHKDGVVFRLNHQNVTGFVLDIEFKPNVSGVLKM